MVGRGKGLVRGNAKGGSGGSRRGKNGKRQRAKGVEEEKGPTEEAQRENTTPSPKKKKESFLSKHNPFNIIGGLEKRLQESADKLREETQVYLSEMENTAAVLARSSSSAPVGGTGGPRGHEKNPGCSSSASLPPAGAKSVAGPAQDSSEWIDIIEEEEAKRRTAAPAGNAGGSAGSAGPLTTQERLALLQSRFDSGASLGERELTAILLSTLGTLATKEARIEKLVREMGGLKEEVTSLKSEMNSLKGEIQSLKHEKEREQIRLADKEMIGKQIDSSITLDSFRQKITTEMSLTPEEVPHLQRLRTPPEVLERLKAKGQTPASPIKMTWTTPAARHAFLAKLRRLPPDCKTWRFEMSLPPCRREIGRKLLYESFTIRKRWPGIRTSLRYENGLNLYIAVKLPSDTRYSRFDPSRLPPAREE